MKQKSELPWIGKSKTVRLVSLILPEYIKMFCHSMHLGRNNDTFDNHLIFGKPIKSLFLINYKPDMVPPKHIPDFVAETDNTIFMVAE